MEQLPTPHNNFFHFALSHLPNARSLIETQLSEAALSELRMETLQLETGSYIDPDLSEKFSDLLFSVQLAQAASPEGKQQAFVYLLFEHKSQNDPFTVLQLLSYIVRIWEKQLRDGQTLCPIVPLVVYHGESGWNAGRALSDLIPTTAGLDAYAVHFSPPLLDLSQLSDADIEGEAVLQATLRLLKYSRSQQLLGKLVGILKQIEQSLQPSLLDQWLKAIGVYVMSVNKNIDSQQYKQTLKSVFPTQFEPGSLADRLLTQGHEVGLVSGKIQLVQELLGIAVSSKDDLVSRSREELEGMLSQLQKQLRDRDA